ncbi:MAG: YbaB/EbfC family nucleoid-associated protein [Vicinamibacteria bacterium]|nr:YbaB/EbfC family nucleoid-associated protein [Vicinamibacteria bacterium]
MNPFGDPRKLMKQFQQAQERIQEEIAAMSIEASSGGGMVKAVLTGDKKLVSLTIDPQVVNQEDVEMLQDLILAAINEAAHKADLAVHEKIGGLTAGLKIPGLM